MHLALKRQKGFTIVELLIVVVVIAILAAITIVSYNGITNRAQFTSLKSDLATINKAILLYHADNGTYPSSTSSCMNAWCGWNQVTGNSFIPGLSPKYLASIPQMPTENVNEDTFLYSSGNGTSYRLMRFKSAGLPAHELSSPLTASPTFSGTGWGYKSNNIDWAGNLL